jgi:hypothetical protein
VFSSIVIVLGVGLGGGVAGAFSFPGGEDAISNVAWAITCVLIFAPFLLLLTRLIRRLLK